jgi:hypothetical protein
MRLHYSGMCRLVTHVVSMRQASQSHSEQANQAQTAGYLIGW